MARRTKAVVLALLVYLAVAAPAAADDASLLAAYNGHQRGLQEALDLYTNTLDEIPPGGATKHQLRTLIEANNRMIQILGYISDQVQGQIPSTAHGHKAKAAALREITFWQQANEFEDRGIEAELAGHSREAVRWYRRSNRVYRRYEREVRRVRAAFRAAGLKSPRSGVGG
jgi:PAS domain-containing protein